MKHLLLILLGLILAGCEARATPIEAIITPTSTPQATTAPISALRYGVAANLAPYIEDLADTVSFEVFDGNSAIDDYDIVVAYGVYDNWQQSPQSHRVSLAINPNLAPLDNMIIRDLIPQLIDTQAIINNLNIPNAQQTNLQSQQAANDIRTALANAGYPDGFQLTMATESIPAIDVLLGQFSALSLDLRLIEVNDRVLSDNQAHMVLFMWVENSERSEWLVQVGEENVIDLWTLPISYIVSENVSVEFNQNGLPIPSR